MTAIDDTEGRWPDTYMLLYLFHYASFSCLFFSRSFRWKAATAMPGGHGDDLSCIVERGASEYLEKRDIYQKRS